MTAEPRVEAVAVAIYAVDGEPMPWAEYVGDGQHTVFRDYAVAAVAALDAYDREHAPASQDAKWIAQRDVHLRESIARDIEAEAARLDALTITHQSAIPRVALQNERQGLILAARIARGGAS